MSIERKKRLLPLLSFNDLCAFIFVIYKICYIISPECRRSGIYICSQYFFMHFFSDVNV